MKKLTALFLGLGLAFSLTACGDGGGVKPFQGMEKTVLADLPVVDIYENFSVAEGQSLALLDANGEQALFALNERYQEPHLSAAEQGFTDFTLRLLRINRQDGAVLEEITLPVDSYCPSGALLQDKILYSQFSLGEKIEGAAPYQILDSQTETALAVGEGAWWAEALPTVYALSDSTALYSYVNQKTGDFGLSVFDETGAETGVFTKTDSAEHLQTRLSVSHGRFLYFLGQDKAPTLLVGDETGVLKTITLEKDEYFYDFALFEDTILLSLENRATEPGKQLWVLRDFEGKTLDSMKAPTLAFASSDGVACVLGVRPETKSATGEARGLSAMMVQKGKIKTYGFPSITTAFPLAIKAVGEHKFALQYQDSLGVKGLYSLDLKK